MNRLLAAMKMDVTLQVRTQLYSIGIGAGVLVAVALAWLAQPQQMVSLIPTLMLLVVGGSTMLYVAAMILFEKEQGTLKATNTRRGAAARQ
jgi:fluoroquinolone transport system permease protein